MRNFTRRLLWLFVFTVPWDVVILPGLGAPSRLVGLGTLGAAILTTAMAGRFRKPGMIFGFASTFIAFAALSLLWTIAFPITFQLVWTSIQILGSVWVVREFARTRDEQQSLLVAFCLGEFVPLAPLLNSFNVGVTINRFSDRYSAMGFNADDLGMTLVIGVPIAWHLMMTYDGVLRRTVRAAALVYFAVAPFAILLTGTRGAVLATVVALSIVPLTLPQRSLRSFFAIAVILIVVAGTTVLVVPQRTWLRVVSIKSEVLDGGSMTGRADIWAAGLRVFPERPLVGAGLGTFGDAVEPLLNKRSGAHNLPLGMLVELGVVGFSLYAALLAACGVTIFRMPPSERKLWAVLMLSWMIGVMSLNWETRKVTWLLFAMVAAHGASETASRRRPRSLERLTETPVKRQSLRTVYSPSLDQGAIR